MSNDVHRSDPEELRAGVELHAQELEARAQLAVAQEQEPSRAGEK